MNRLEVQVVPAHIIEMNMNMKKEKGARREPLPFYDSLIITARLCLNKETVR